MVACNKVNSTHRPVTPAGIEYTHLTIRHKQHIYTKFITYLYFPHELDRLFDKADNFAESNRNY
jgi:hypothetical protein